MPRTARQAEPMTIRIKGSKKKYRPEDLKFEFTARDDDEALMRSLVLLHELTGKLHYATLGR